MRVIAGNADWLAKNPDVAVRFMRALWKGQQYNFSGPKAVERAETNLNEAPDIDSTVIAQLERPGRRARRLRGGGGPAAWARSALGWASWKRVEEAVVAMPRRAARRRCSDSASPAGPSIAATPATASSAPSPRRAPRSAPSPRRRRARGTPRAAGAAPGTRLGRRRRALLGLLVAGAPRRPRRRPGRGAVARGDPRELGGARRGGGGPRQQPREPGAHRVAARARRAPARHRRRRRERRSGPHRRLRAPGYDALARRRAALITLTGIDFEAQQAVALRPRPTEEEDEAGAALPSDPDAPLPWPSALVLPALCAVKRGELAPGGRYLLGKPIAAPWLEEVLATGSQLHRRGAAVESLLAPASPLPETRGHSVPRLNDANRRATPLRRPASAEHALRLARIDRHQEAARAAVDVDARRVRRSCAPCRSASRGAGRTAMCRRPGSPSGLSATSGAHGATLSRRRRASFLAETSRSPCMSTHSGCSARRPRRSAS